MARSNPIASGFLFVLTLVLIGAIGAPFFIEGPDNEPLLNTKDIKMPQLVLPGVDVPDMDEVARSLRKMTGVDNRPMTVYRWRDEAGNWHFTNQPPPDTPSGMEKVVVQAANIVPEEAPQAARAAVPQESGAGDGNPFGERGIAKVGESGLMETVVDTYTHIPELVEETHQAAAGMESHYAAAEEMLHQSP